MHALARYPRLEVQIPVLKRGRPSRSFILGIPSSLESPRPLSRGKSVKYMYRIST